MSETRKAAERLDALLAGLEDSVLQTGAMAQGGLENDGTSERVETIRSDIEALIRLSSQKTVGTESERGTAGQVAGTKARVVQAMARLGLWASVGPRVGVGRTVSRVRMAFSGAQPEKSEDDERGEAHRRKGRPEDKTRQGG